VLRIESDKFRRIAASETELMQTVLSAMAERTQDVEAQTRQREKMSALGKMAAGLAHELNNPAAAARRSAGQLREAVAHLQREAVRCDCRLSGEQRETATELTRKLAERSSDRVELDPLTRSDREDEISNWLERHGVANGWELASPLAGAGVTTAELEELADSLHGQTLRAAIGWIQVGIQVAELAADVEASAARISDLVRVMKEYSYMDQTAFHELDVRGGLDSTLRMFAHRMKGGVKLVKEYSPDAPKICGYGNELNQVWTNLIDNALDAMEGRGTLRVRTQAENDGVLVEVIDSGPGIPEDIQNRIFEPFFTTKDVGRGTGLGLDISYRIVTNPHGGTIRVASNPGETRFQVWLPKHPPKQEG
jgi:signal transduction histidine kinase